MDGYPIKERIKAKAGEAKKTLTEVAAEVEKSDRWLHGVTSISDLTLEMIMRLGIACKFDFLKDYNEWLLDHEKQPIIMVAADPTVPYVRKQKNISVSISVKAPMNKFNDAFGDLLNELKETGEKHGFEVGV